jgi:signal transduction histidine kinase
LLSVIGLVFILFVIKITDWLLNDFQGAVSTSVVFIILSLFVFLYFLSRKGFILLASFIFLGIFFFLNSYTAFTYGIDVPEGILVYALIIIMSGILLGSQYAFLVTTVTVGVISLVGYLHTSSIFLPKSYWRSEILTIADIITFGITFLIIAIISWLSNREIEKSLARARRSEAELKKERDSLEITVEQRTRDLKETQAEKMTQLYRFAEFGRLSSGLFHDLINPLTAVSLNLEQAKNVGETKQCVDKAVRAAKKMEDIVSAVRKQLSRQENKTLFSVNDEIAQALEVLAHKAQKSGVAIRLFSREEIKTYGDAVKFNQVALNLIANAIDAYQEKTNVDSKPITMSLSKENSMIIFEVKDKGVGISEENKPKLFEPFFTTKKEGYGLGIGLSMIKRIIEKDFGGSISVESREGEGAVFTIKFPQKENG